MKTKCAAFYFVAGPFISLLSGYTKRHHGFLVSRCSSWPNIKYIGQASNCSYLGKKSSSTGGSDVVCSEVERSVESSKVTGSATAS